MASQSEDVAKQWSEFTDLNAKLRANIKLMAKQKENLLSKHGADREKAKQEVDKLYDETCKMFTYLSSLKHNSLKRREAFQNDLNDLCKHVDNRSLGVKNFEYEQVDTLKQIAICTDYQSHKNQPILVDKQEFYRNNPQITQPIDDIHKEKTLRLRYELQQRKQLQSNLRQITQNVMTLSTELAEKKKFVNNLQSKISNVFNAILPLQTYMNLPQSMIYPNEQEIDALPSPLFAIYQSFITQIHCNQILATNIEIKISKRSNNDMVIVKKAKNKNNKISVLGKRKYKELKKTDKSPQPHSKNESSNSDNSHSHLEDGEIGLISQEPPRKRTRSSNKSSKDKEKKDKNREKSSSKKYRSRSNSSSKNKNESNNNNSDKKQDPEKEQKEHNAMSTALNQMIDGMKLSVQFKKIGIALEFVYCSTYNLILVSVQRQRNIANGDNEWKYEDPNIFQELFAGHTMIELPVLLREQRLLANGSLVPFFSAFSWAQEVAGSYIFNRCTTADKKREIINLQTLEHALKERKESRISLQQQIKHLMDGNKCALFMQNIIKKAFEDNKMFPVNRIVSFALITDKKLRINAYSTYFRVVLERVPYSLNCLVEIMAAYSDKAPLFYVKDIFNKHIKKKERNYFVNACKNIEIKLNGDFNEYVTEKNKHLLLSMMIYKLQIYFDVYVQSESMEMNGNLVCNQLSGSPIRIHRGRDRRQQY